MDFLGYFNDNSLEELISYEFSCLLELGFQPKIHRYVENYPTLTGLPELLSKDLLENDESLIEIRSPSRETYRTYAGYDPIVFGRQQQNEAESYAESFDGSGRRIIVVDRGDTRVSRNHLRLTRTANDEFEVANVSTKSEIIASGRKLDPGGSCLVTNGQEIRFGAMSIELRK